VHYCKKTLSYFTIWWFWTQDGDKTKKRKSYTTFSSKHSDIIQYNIVTGSQHDKYQLRDEKFRDNYRVQYRMSMALGRFNDKNYGNKQDKLLGGGILQYYLECNLRNSLPSISTEGFLKG
jgi:hypothetical protein